ncbi:hypothetical protein V8G54_014900 [Vigna mungo]|uniref:Uncharacterized protein n=1 Tax=Vigna mungo TaxID=3915 RepID=A0AAQ3NIH5_VIGMU
MVANSFLLPNISTLPMDNHSLRSSLKCKLIHFVLHIFTFFLLLGQLYEIGNGASVILSLQKCMLIVVYFDIIKWVPNKCSLMIIVVYYYHIKFVKSFSSLFFSLF